MVQYELACNISGYSKASNGIYYSNGEIGYKREYAVRLEG